jgi:hypothetical protein
LPAARCLPAELAPLECVDAEQPKVDRDRIAVERPCFGVEALGGGRRAGDGAGDRRECKEHDAAHQETISTSTWSPATVVVQTRKG